MTTRTALLAAASFAALLAGCGDDGGAERRGAGVSKTIAVRGTITVTENVSTVEGQPGACYVDGGYDDVAEGEKITVTGPNGDVVGLGEVKTGSYFEGQSRYLDFDDECAFAFSANVPAGLGFYGFATGARPPTRFTEADLRQAVKLTLG